MKPKVNDFHYIYFNTNNRMLTQIPHTQYGHQKIQPIQVERLTEVFVTLVVGVAM